MMSCFRLHRQRVNASVLALALVFIFVNLDLHDATLRLNGVINKSISVRNTVHVLSLPLSNQSQTDQGPDDARQRILPISFGLPEGRFERAKHFGNIRKTRDFALIVPGAKSTYIYKTEESYYDGYAQALFGITFKKSGWDCLRHYEIIAAGTMPYIIDLDELPPNTMHDFPVDIVKRAMLLPGMPSERKVEHFIRMKKARFPVADLKINYRHFNRTAYDELMQELIDYSLKHLTWAAKARYVFSNVQRFYPCLTQPRVLFVTVPHCEYMSCILWGGVYEELGTESMSSLFGPKDELFESLATERKSYGRGFSYSNTYKDWDKTTMDQLLKERLDKGYFNVIIYTNGGNGYCAQKDYYQNRPDDDKNTLYDYQRKHNPLVIAVDGNDIHGCHQFFHEERPLHYHMHFVREYEEALWRNNDLPQTWSGCNGTFDVDS